MNVNEEELFWMKVGNLYMEQANAALERAAELRAESRREEKRRDVEWLGGKRKVIRIDAS